MALYGKAEVYTLMTSDKRNYEREHCAERVKSFIIRRNNNEKHVKNQNIFMLARAGFECRDDFIRCAYCLKVLEIKDDEEKMNLNQILKKHKDMAPECKYLIPYVQKPRYEDMKDIKERRKSFDAKKIHEAFSRISLEDLTCMGLFYREGIMEYLICYQCGKEIEYNEIDKHKSINSIWQMHANQRGYCSRVIFFSGISYQEKYQPIDDVYKEEQRIRTLVNDAYREAKETANYIRYYEWKKSKKKE